MSTGTVQVADAMISITMTGQSQITQVLTAQERRIASQGPDRIADLGVEMEEGLRVGKDIAIEGGMMTIGIPENVIVMIHAIGDIDLALDHGHRLGMSERVIIETAERIKIVQENEDSPWRVTDVESVNGQIDKKALTNFVSTLFYTFVNTLFIFGVYVHVYV